MSDRPRAGSTARSRMDPDRILTRRGQPVIGRPAVVRGEARTCDRADRVGDRPVASSLITDPDRARRTVAARRPAIDRSDPEPIRAAEPPVRSAEPIRAAEPPGGPPPGQRPWQSGPPTPRWEDPRAALPAPDLLGPDEELVAGRRPVEEVFAAGRAALRLLVVPQRRNALEQLVLHATRLRIPIVEVEGGSLTAIAGFDGHQGVALVVEPREFATLDDILARAEERGEPPFVLVLDSLEDPAELRHAPAQCRGRRRPRDRLPDPAPGPAQRSRGQGIGRCRRASPAQPGRRPGRGVGRPPRPRPAHRRFRGGRATDRAPDRPAGTAGDRRRKRGSGARAVGAATLRPVDAHPDARLDRLAQCGSRRVRAAVRGAGPARSGRPAVDDGHGTERLGGPPFGGTASLPDADDAAPPTDVPPDVGPDATPAADARTRTTSSLAGLPQKRPPSHRRKWRSRRVRHASHARPEPPALDPSGRPALSFPGADGSICGMALRVAPT